ncbi:UNVERIFIED_CONTAM: hypothetical protein FKN15_001143 [Acipenser sinensis]
MGENTLLFVYKAQLTEVGYPMQPARSILQRDEVTEPGGGIHSWMAAVTAMLQLIHSTNLKNRAVWSNTEMGDAQQQPNNKAHFSCQTAARPSPMEELYSPKKEIYNQSWGDCTGSRSHTADSKRQSSLQRKRGGC